MKLRVALFLTALGAFVAVHAAEPAIEFSGVLTTDGTTKIALTNKATGVTTWVGPGENFLGYTVARYEAKDDAVFLRKNGQDIRLPLTTAKTIASATPAAASTETSATANAIRGNLRMLAAAARRYQNEHGAATVTYMDIVGPDKYIKDLRPVAGENYSNLTFAPNTTTVSIALPDGAAISVELAPATSSTTNAVASQPATPAAAPGTTTGTLAPTATPPPATLATTPTPAATPPPPPAATPLPPVVAANPPSSALPSDPTSSATTTTTTVTQPLEPTGRAVAPTIYTTGNDDTWETISQKTGVPAQKLKEVNSPISSGSSLPPGQIIRLK
jgi:hypothetical protein